MDLRKLFADINSLDPTVLVVQNSGGQAVSGSIELDDRKMNELLIQARLPIRSSPSQLGWRILEAKRKL